MNQYKIEISPKTIIFALLIVLLAWVACVSKEVILLIFASFIVASAMVPTIDWMSKKMPRGVAILIMFVIAILGVTILAVPFFAILIEQIKTLVSHFPIYYSKIHNLLLNIRQSGNLDYIPNFEQLISKSFDYSQGILTKSFDITMEIFAGIVTLFTVATIVAFMLLDSKEMGDGFLKFFKKEERERISHIVKTISVRLGGYVRGQLAVMFFVGLVTGVVLAFMKVPFALLLGIIAGVLEVVPVIGPIIAAGVAIIIAFFVSPWLALGTGVAIFIIQRVQNIFTPFIYGKYLNMSPLVIICAIMLAANTLGVIGVILSPAIAATIYVLIQELYLKKINPDENFDEISDKKKE